MRRCWIRMNPSAWGTSIGKIQDSPFAEMIVVRNRGVSLRKSIDWKRVISGQEINNLINRDGIIYPMGHYKSRVSNTPKCGRQAKGHKNYTQEYGYEFEWIPSPIKPPTVCQEKRRERFQP